MKKVYVELKNNLPINVDVQNAIDGFEYLDYEPIGFNKSDLITGKLDNIGLKNIVVGSIDGMRLLFRRINKLPQPIDFPDFLFVENLLNREVKQIRLNEFIEDFKLKLKPKFVKPVETKIFDGALISKLSHLNYLNNYGNPLVWVSEPMNIVSEYRIYVHDNQMVYSCNYCGDFKQIPLYSYIEDLISKFKNSPISYTIDVGILKNGETSIIEFNDFWAIGSYGLYCIDYSHMLEDRYFEIIK